MKSKAILIASILAEAGALVSAFAPQKDGGRLSTAANAETKFKYENEIGAQVPFGYYDPLGLVYDVDQERFDNLRYTELKHGRICMLGVVGYLYTYAGNRLPGVEFDGKSWEDIRYGFAAFQDLSEPGVLVTFATIGLLETFVMKDVTGDGEFLGDFRNGFYDPGWDLFSEETKIRKRGIELNQGRAAMMGMLALMVHEQIGVPLLPDVVSSIPAAVADVVADAGEAVSALSAIKEAVTDAAEAVTDAVAAVVE